MSRPYPEYRDSGDEWLGALPSHWSVRRLKQVADAFPSNVDKKSHEGELPVRLCNYTDVYYNDVIADAEGLMVATASEEQVEKFSLRAGDVIITKDSETADDIAVSAYVPDDLPGVVCGYHLSMIRPKAGTSGAFLKRYFDSHYAKSSVAVRANGLTRVGLGQYAVDNLFVPVPPLEEQIAIAAFLDQETAKIDALVEAQRRLIDLLKEKRQAVVLHAVTKGFDPAAPTKESGIEWLGEAPCHWTVTRLRFIARLNPSKSEVSCRDRDEEVSFLPMDAIGEDGSLRLDRTRSLEQVETGYTYFRDGDVAVAKITPCFENGKGAVMRGLVGGVGFGTTELIVVRPSAGNSSDFLHWLFNSTAFRKLGEGAMYGAGGQKRVPDDFVRDFRLALPPPPEQSAIAAFLDRETGTLDSLIAEAEVGISLLRERRARLISAAVTGAIDVRKTLNTPEVVEQATARRLVGAAVLELVADSPASSRMTSAKRMYLAEVHAGVWELRGQPQRMAAGPFDGALMSDVESELARVGHIATAPGGPNSKVHYCLTGHRGALRAELDALLGDRRATFDKMLADLGALESKGVEAVATLYAVWNDMLIDGKTPTDDAVIDGVLNDWHAEKRDKFTKADLRNYLGWISRHGMTPTGRGPRTKSGALL